MKILNLYAGIGGNRKLWGDKHEVTAIENNKEIAQIYMDFFSDDKVIVTDAHQYLLKHYKEFDFIWSSPPCPTHSKMKIIQVKSNHPINKTRTADYPDMRLYQEILLLKHFFDGKFVIENVVSYYQPLIKPVELYRHYFWSNFIISISKNKFLGIEKLDTIHSNEKELMKHYDIFVNFDKYKINIDKGQLIRNCVHPKLALHIFNMAFKEKQEVLQ